MFHNNKMSEILQPYAGVERVLGRERECTPLVKIDQDGRGLSILAFCDHKNIFWAMEAITGYRKSSSNPFFWDVVIRNSPGTTSHYPTMPRLHRWDSIREEISATCKTYVDDLRSIVATQSLAKEATHQVDTTMVYLVLQDATKKRRPISQTPG